MKPTIVSLHPPIIHDHHNDDASYRIEWAVVFIGIFCLAWTGLACVGAVTVWRWWL